MLHKLLIVDDILLSLYKLSPLKRVHPHWGWSRRLSLSEPTDHAVEGEEDEEESGAVIAGSSMWVDKHVGGTKTKRHLSVSICRCSEVINVSTWHCCFCSVWRRFQSRVRVTLETFGSGGETQVLPWNAIWFHQLCRLWQSLLKSTRRSLTLLYLHIPNVTQWVLNQSTKAPVTVAPVWNLHLQSVKRSLLTN